MDDQIKPGKKEKFKSLTFTIAFAFLALICIILLIAGSAEIFFNLQTQKKEVDSQQILIAQNAANTVTSFVEQKEMRLETAVKIGSLDDTSPEEQTFTLEKVLGLEPSFRQLVLINPSGQVLAKASRMSNLVSSKLTDQNTVGIVQLVKNEKIYISQVYIDDVTSEPMVIMAVPVTNVFGDFKGVLMAEVNLKFMWDLVEKIKIGRSGLAYVVDNEGNLIAFGDINRVLKRENLISLKEVGEFVNNKNLSSGLNDPDNDVEVSKGIKGTYVVSTYSGLGTPDWAVVVELPVLEAYQNIIQLLILLAAIIFLSVALAVFAGIYLSRKITKPIIKLRDAATRIGQGNLDAEIDIQSNDEVGELALSFKQMTDNIKQSRIKLEVYNMELEVKVAQRTQEIDIKDRELIEINKALEEANTELKQIDIRKDEFISIAAHELKTPLTSIRGFAQLLQNKDIISDSEKREHYLSLINRNTDRLYNLILDVVDASRISLGHLKINTEDVDIYKLFNEIKENMEIIIREKGLSPIFSIEENIPKISADYIRTLQILRNIMINAVHYTEKGTVSLKIKRKENSAEFEITDTGMGISKENQKYIFSRFYQEDSTLTRKIGGSGLGLSISQGLVELMNGKIWFESEERKGNEILLYNSTCNNKQNKMIKTKRLLKGR